MGADICAEWAHAYQVDNCQFEERGGAWLGLGWVGRPTWGTCWKRPDISAPPMKRYDVAL